MIDEKNGSDDTNDLTLTAKIPDEAIDTLAPEQEVAMADVVMPNKVMSPQEIEIRKQLDYIKKSASINLGVDNEFLGGDHATLLEAAASEDKATAIKALQAIAADVSYTPEQRAFASQQAYDHSRSFSAAAPITDRAASIIKYAVENELIEDGSLEERQDVVEAFRNGDAALQTDIEMSLDSTEDLAAFRDAVSKGGVQYGLSVLTDIVNERSKLISTDTLLGFVPAATEQSTDNFYKELGKISPEIGAIMKRFGFAGSIIERGKRDAQIMEAVAKLPEAKQVELAERIITMMHDSTLDSVLAHVNADVVDILFRRTIDPKSGKYSWDDVQNANGVRETLGVAMKTPAAEWIGREIIRPGLAVLDYVPAVAIVKNLVTASAKRIIPQIKATTRLVSLVRPRASTDLAMAASESDEAAKAFGYASRDEALISMMPSEKGFYTSPNIAHNVQERIIAEAQFRKRTLEEMFSVSHTPLNIADPATLVEGYMNHMAAGRIVPHTAYTSITASDGVFNVSGIFGKSDIDGYKSAKEAITTAKAFFDNAPVQAVLRKRTTGQLIHPEDASYKALVKDASKNKTEYDWWARLDTKQPLWKVESAVVGDTSTNMIGSFLSGNTKIGRNLFGGMAQLVSSDILTKGAYVAGNSRFATDQFKKLIDLSAVPIAERRPLSAVLYRQNRERSGAILSSEQLKSQGISSLEGQAAYYNTKITLDTVKRLVDNNFAESLTREGFKDVVDADGVRIGFGKATTTDGLAVNKTYNVRVVDEGVDDVVTLTGAQLDNMAKKGFSLYQSKIAEFAKRTSDAVDVETTHIMVANTVKGRQVLDIRPDGVLNYSPGYTPEIRTGRIAIEGITESGRRHIVGFVDTISEAKVVLQQLSKDAKLLKKFPNGIKQTIYKGMSHEYQAIGNRETYENLNGLVYGKKGDEIQNFSGVNGDATMLDPLEAIEHMTSMLAQQYTKGRHIEYLEDLATEFAKKHELMRDGVSSVRTAEDLISGGVIGDRAVALKSLNNFLMHVDAQRLVPDIVERKAASAWAAAANWAANKQLPVIGRAIEKLAIKQAQSPANILRWLTTYNYYTKIRTNPIKHRVMNIASALINVSNPIAMAKGLKQRAAFNAAIDLMDSRTLASDAIERALIAPAKAFGVGVPELKEIVKAYREGGVYNAADNNVLFRNSLETESQILEMRALAGAPKGANVRAKASALMQQLNKTLAEVGDVAGEREAMLTTFLTQYNVLKGQKGFNIFSQASKEKLVAKTMVLSGNMVGEGSLAMQKGMFRAMFQFHSYSVKMYWNALAPKWLGGSQLLSAQDKYGMAITQLLMFGADAVVGARYAATNVASAWANDKELSDDERMRRNQWLIDSGTQRLVENGVIGLFLNNYLKSYVNAYEDKDSDGSEYGDLDFASFLAVTGGASIVENTLRNTMKGFGEAGLILSAVGGPDGWWPATQAAGGAVVTSFMGVNGETPANIMDSIMSVARITGSAYRGEEPLWAPADASRKAVAEHVFAMSRPMVAMAISKRYGEEIVNGKPRNKSFEAGLDSTIKMFFGLQSIDEKDAHTLHEAMRAFNAKNYYGSTGYKMAMKNDARSYVNGVIKDLVYLNNTTGDEQLQLREAVLNRHGKLLAAELASMGTYDALEYEAAINEAIDEIMSKESIERTVLQNALGMMGNDVASYKDFSYIKNIMGDSPLIRKNPETLDSYVTFINKWVEETFGDYE